MALEKLPLNINFSQGLDQKTDPKQVKPGKFLSLVNRIFNKGGLLQKRNGYSALGKTVATPATTYAFSQVPSTIATGRNVAPFKDELTLNDGLNLYSYSSSSNNWIYKGRAEVCSATSQSIYKNPSNNILQDSALNSTLGINVFAWESWTADPYMGGSKNGVQISCVDAVQGQTIFNAYLASNTSRPKCVSISNKLYVLYFNSSDNKIYAQPVTQTGLGVAVAIITNVNATTPNYDVLVNNSLIYVAYNGTSSTVKVASFDSTLAAVASVSKSEVGTNGVGIFPDTANNVWIPYNNGSETKAFIMDSALAVTVLAPTIVDAGAGASGVLNVTGVYDGTRGIIFYDKPGLPLVGQIDTTTNGDFVQPAVGATVTVVRLPTAQANTIVYIAGGGYYFCGAQVSATTQAYTLTNLGFAGNASPGATISTGAAVSATAGYQNSIVTFNTLTAAGVAGTAAIFLRSVALGSKAFLVNGVAHVVLSHDSPLQATYFVGALYNTASPVPNAAIVAKIAESAGGGVPYRSVLPAVNVVSTGIVQFASPERTFDILRTSNSVPHVVYLLGVTSSQIDFTTNDIKTNDLGSNLQIGSGTLLMYDGANTVEQGFHLYPETVSIVNAVSGSGCIGEGTYGYQVVYEWIDNQGQTHRSAPSPIVSVESAGESESTMTLPTLRITEKQNATIAVYRTLANGTVYFRVDTVSTTFPIENSVSTDSVTFVDNASDDNISGNEQLYTAQEVENIAVPATNLMTEYKNRVIAIPSVNPYTWWFSKQVISGSPVEFSDLFQQSAGTVGGHLKGVIKLDDKLILFKSGSLYYVTGTGPSPSGQNNDFTDAQFITSDTGLSDPRSLVSTPMGAMFKSGKGIYLLDRSLNTIYVGAAVEDYNQYTVRGAELISNANQVRFLLSNGQSLVYDYYWTDQSGIGQWAVFSNTSGVSSCIYSNLQTYVTSAGQVYKESLASYLDGATSVDTSFKTGWLNLAGLQGFERAYFFYFLAQYLSSHTLTINIYYDYDATTVAQTLTITPNSTDLEQWRVFLTRQKCEAFQIEVIESSAGSGAGFTMSGLDILVGIKGAHPRLKAAASAS